MRRADPLEAAWRAGGLPSLISKAKAVGGDALAEEAVTRILEEVLPLGG